MYSSNPNDYHQYPSNPNDYHQYSSNQNDYQKFSPSAPPAAPPIFSRPTVTGYPVTPQNPPGALQVQSQAPVPWSTGLCDCGQDVGNCCITCCCPCITFGQISDIVGKGSPSCIANGALYALISFVTGCGCLYSCFYRSKMRQQYSLNESPCGDCLVHCCCECCALCQEYRELKNRGFNMSIGWQGNVENQRRGAAMAPVIQEGMNR